MELLNTLGRTLEKTMTRLTQLDSALQPTQVRDSQLETLEEPQCLLQGRGS